MSIVRSPRPESHYAIYSNEVIRDGRLSYKARGILLELLSRPDNWRVDAKSLAASGQDGRDSILAGLTELRNLGYIVTFKRQNEKGQFETLSVVYDFPQTPKSGNPESGKPESEKPTSLDVPRKKNREELATPKGVADLVQLYFDNFKGEIRPSGGQIGSHIKTCLKQLSEERLRELIPLVALDGKPVTVNTIAFYANRQQPESKPTYTPPAFKAEEAPQGVKPPKNIRELAGLKKVPERAS